LDSFSQHAVAEGHLGFDVLFALLLAEQFEDGVGFAAHCSPHDELYFAFADYLEQSDLLLALDVVEGALDELDEVR
jgi:hypothetical protein